MLKKSTTPEAKKLWKTVSLAAKRCPEFMKEEVKLAAQKERKILSDNILSAEFVGKTVEDPDLGIGIIRNVEDGFANIEFIESEGQKFMVINLEDLEKQ